MNTKEFKTYADKEKFVQGVFSNIAKNYDLMNTVLSFGQGSITSRAHFEGRGIRL